MHRFWRIHQNLNSNGFFQPLEATHSVKIWFLAINYLAKFFIKVHRFRLIHQKLNSKDFFRALVILHFFKIQFSTIIFLAKFFIEKHRFRLILRKLYCPCNCQWLNTALFDTGGLRSPARSAHQPPFLSFR